MWYRPSQDNLKLCEVVEGDVLVRCDNFQGKHHPLSVMSVLH
jgi:hypothetical protein